MIIITIRRIHILSALVLSIFSLVFFCSGNAYVFASLTCSITTSCTNGTVLFRTSSTTNAHSELPTQSLYPNLVCCTGVTGIGNSCANTFAVVAHLSSTTNAHIEQANQSNYTNNICLQASSGGTVTVGYQDTNCNGFDTTVVSISSSTNAHVGNASAYTRKICASVTQPGLSFTIDSPTQSLSVTPNVLAATTSLLFASTSNTTGFAISIQKQNPVTLQLNTNSNVSIPDKTEWFAPAATTSVGNSTASTTQPLTLQFRIRQAGTDVPNYSSVWWGNDDTTANALFAGISSTTQTIINRSVATVGTTTSTVLYNVEVGPTQQSGVYSGTILYSITANP